MGADNISLHPAAIFDEGDMIVATIAPGSIEARVAATPDLMTILINAGERHGVKRGALVRVMEQAQTIVDPDDPGTTLTLQRNNGFFLVDVVRVNFSLCSLTQLTSRTSTIAPGDPCWIENPAATAAPPAKSPLVRPPSFR